MSHVCLFCAFTSPGKDPECCWKRSASDVSKVSAVLLAVSAESGESYISVRSEMHLFHRHCVILYKSNPFPSNMAHYCVDGSELVAQTALSSFAFSMQRREGAASRDDALVCLPEIDRIDQWQSGPSIAIDPGCGRKGNSNRKQHLLPRLSINSARQQLEWDRRI